MANVGSAKSYQRPESPWAEQYYPSEVPFWRDTGPFVRSALAPELPTIAVENRYGAPWYYGGGSFPRPDNQELDRLFYAERIQREDLIGILTWQVGDLAGIPHGYASYSATPDSPNDPRWKSFYHNQIRVDESKWFWFFRKENWFDQRNCAPDLIRHPFPSFSRHPDKFWTVDNPIVWKHLRVSLEIANRTLLRLIMERDPFLDALCFADIQQWRDFDHDIYEEWLLHPETFNPEIIYERAEDQRAGADVLAAQVRHLCRNFVFSFMDETYLAHPSLCLGVTLECYNPPGSDRDEYQGFLTVACVHAGLLRLLCDETARVSERCNVYVQVAMAILHELMHAIRNARDKTRPSWPTPSGEPHFAPDLAAEVGEAFDSRVWGGCPRIKPLGKKSQCLRGANTHIVVMPWPRQEHVRHLPPAVSAPVRKRDVDFSFPVLATWSSALQTEQFWQSAVVRDWRSAFRGPRVFRTEQARPDHYFHQRTYAARPVRIEGEPSELIQEYETVQNNLQYRRHMWNVMRPWAKDEYRLWSISPWSWYQARDALEQFRVAHARRDLATCLLHARQFYGLQNTINRRSDEGKSTDVLWLWVAIGALMMTSLPMLPHDMTSKTPLKTFTVYPSKTAAAISHWGTYRPYYSRHQIHMEEERETTTTWQTVEFQTRFEPMFAFQLYFQSNCQAIPLPRAWLVAVFDQARAYQGRFASYGVQPEEWLDFDLEVPPYDTDWALGSQTGQSVGLMGLMNFPSVVPPTIDWGYFPSPVASPSQGPKIGANDPPTAVFLKRFRNPEAALDQDDTRTSNERPETRPRFYSISEVGNHIRNDSVWVVEPDENDGFDVFNITALCWEMGYNTTERIRDELLDVDEQGPMLKADINGDAEWIRARLGHDIQPRGKLLIRRRVEEIAEFNGEQGMPLWIFIGQDVFDITDFLFTSQEEKQSLTRNPGGIPTSLPKTQEEKADLLRRLLPYRCALVELARGNPRTTLLPMTARQLRWHDNPTTGMYTAIKGIIYDVTSYLEDHPGGRTALLKCLGREATDFHKYHDLDLMDNHYSDLAIGRLVPEVSFTDLEKNQVVIHDWVFDVARLLHDDSSDSPATSDSETQTSSKYDNRSYNYTIYTIAKSLAGTDVSHALKSQDATGSALNHLYLHNKHCIVARLASEKERTIPLEETKKHNDPNSPLGAWVVIGNRVWDVTHIMLHGPPFFAHEIPRAWAGKHLPAGDVTLRRWLMNEQKQRCIGHVVEGQAWDPRGKEKKHTSDREESKVSTSRQEDEAREVPELEEETGDERSPRRVSRKRMLSPHRPRDDGEAEWGDTNTTAMGTESPRGSPIPKVLPTLFTEKRRRTASPEGSDAEWKELDARYKRNRREGLGEGDG